MVTTHPCHALALADRRGQELQATAATERSLRRGHPALAALLRWTADRLDPAAPLAQRPASQP
jgi:hypothetical protein